MKKTYKTKTNHGDFSLLAHIATQDLVLEIKHTHNSVAKWTKIHPPFSHKKPNNLQFLTQMLRSFVLRLLFYAT